MQRHLLVKDKKGKFNSVSPDMKLEQTIKRASKDLGEIIREQQKEAYVAEWNLVFHEAYLIDDLFYNLSQSKIRDGRDTTINHELIPTSKIKSFNETVQGSVEVISSQGNIFILQQSVSVFQNLLTRQNFLSNVSTRIFNCFSDGTERYKITFEKPKQKEKSCPNEIAASLENRHCKRKMRRIARYLKYDVTESNMHYDGDVMAKHEKSKIIGEIQNLLPEQSVLHDLAGTKMDNIYVIIDLLAVVRSIQKHFFTKTIKDLLDNVIYDTKRVSSPKTIHFVFDSYNDLTIKDS